MDLILKFLINELQTINGSTGSAKRLVELRLPIEEQKLKTLLNSPELTPVQKSNVIQMNKYKIYNKIY